MEIHKDAVVKRGEVIKLGSGLSLDEDTTGHMMISSTAADGESPTASVIPVCVEVALHASGHSDLELSPVPSGLTEISTRLRQWFDTRAFFNCRMVAEVQTAASAGTLVVAQYSGDGGSTWNYFDGSSGPVLSIATTGALRGAWVLLTPGALTDILIRACTYGGDGSTMPILGKLAVEFQVEAQDTTDFPGGGASPPTPLAWHLSTSQVASGLWGDLTTHQNHLTLSGGFDDPTTDGELLNELQTLRFTGNSVFGWPLNMFGSATAGEAFLVAKATGGGGATFLDTFTEPPTRIDDTAPLGGHVPDQGGVWSDWSGPYDEGRTTAGLAIKDDALVDRENGTSGSNMVSEGGGMAQVLGAWAVGDEAFMDVTFPSGSGTASQLFHLAILVSEDAGSFDMPTTNGYLALEYDRGSASSDVDVYAILEWGRVGGGFPGGAYAFEGPYTTSASDKRLGITFVSHEKVSTEEEDIANGYEKWEVEVEAWTEPTGGGSRTVLGSFTWTDADGTYAPASLLTGTRDRIGFAYVGNYSLASVSTAIVTDDCESYSGSNPSPWTLFDPATTNATFTADGTHTHSGSSALHVHLAGLFNPGTVTISRPLTDLDPDSHYEIHFWWYRTGDWGFLGQPEDQWNPQTPGSLGTARFLTSDSSGNATLTIAIAVGGGPNAGADMWIDDIELVGPESRLTIDNLTATPGAGGGGAAGVWALGSGGLLLGDSITDSFGSTSGHGATGDGDNFVLWNPRSSISEWTANVNGEQAVTTATNSVSFPSAPIFGSAGGSPGHFDVAEIMLFDRVLLPSERDVVVAGISQRWNLGLSSPVVPTPGPGVEPLPPVTGGRVFYCGGYTENLWPDFTPPFTAGLFGKVFTPTSLEATLAHAESVGVKYVMNGMPRPAAGSGGSGGPTFNYNQAISYIRSLAPARTMIQHYFDIGVLYKAMWVLDEPFCAHCWGGTAWTGAQVDELAREYRQFMPSDMHYVVRHSGNQLTANYTNWKYINGPVNTIERQFALGRYGDINAWISYQKSILDRFGWTAFWVCNMESAGDGSSGIGRVVDPGVPGSPTAYIVTAQEVVKYMVPMAKISKSHSVGLGLYIGSTGPDDAPLVTGPAYMDAYTTVLNALTTADASEP